jgi:hypothetical protein
VAVSFIGGEYQEKTTDLPQFIHMDVVIITIEFNEFNNFKRHFVASLGISPYVPIHSST